MARRPVRTPPAAAGTTHQGAGRPGRWSSASRRSPSPVARTATLSGHDISWPQCPVAVGGYGLPMPPTSTRFVVVGLTKGLPVHPEPVSRQTRWRG